MTDGSSRRPALTSRVDPIEAAIPARPAPTGGGGGVPQRAAKDMQLNTPLNTRVRASTRERLERAVNKMRYETNDRSISLASLTDQALDAFLSDAGL